ncbi:AAA family ATPase [Sporosarcina cascadiensis]|uniref:AAA family ATPase n=1 Tax=Sporosarcina cascadiensis TaxID=2660747 RepID=UPI00189121F9|nr:AAA family ATPase [Sporosarcina cascadiensis]
MYIKNLQIQNYKQLEEINLNFKKDRAKVVAGENNSGKTSIIRLIQEIVGSRKLKPMEYSILKRPQFEEELKSLVNEDINSDEWEKKYQIFTDKFSIQVKFEIEYEEYENISEIAGYLMDLEPGRNSIYFLLQCIIPKRIILENVEQWKNEVFSFDNVFAHNEWHCYYTDFQFLNRKEISLKDFSKLFNIEVISANKEILDQEKKGRESIATHTIGYLKETKEWDETYKEIATVTKDAIDGTDINATIREKSIENLQAFLKKVRETTGENPLELFTSIKLESKNIEDLLNGGLKVLFKGPKDHDLDEFSQGLGYSNLVKMHLVIETFIEKIKQKNSLENKVHLMIIEEPEAHLHPQMQRVFMEYLYEKIETVENKGIQLLVTSHSREIVQVTRLKDVIVFKNKHYKTSAHELNEIVDMENFLYKINISDLVFADKAILYEGDTERMYLEYIIKTNEKFRKLRQSYIAYIQVGGAYAHKYKNILTTLKIPTLIITDIDYGLECKSKKEVLESESTNAAFKEFLETKNVEQIFIEIKSMDSTIKIVTQGLEDGLARTLEEAMFNRLGFNVFDRHLKEDWKKIRNLSGLNFTVPREGNCFTSRDIVKSSENKKVDFMYSVIAAGLHERALPIYIEEGLEWIQQQKI